MNIESASYMVQPTLSDRVRLSKALADNIGSSEQEVIQKLVHNFFSSTGVKNPRRSARSARTVRDSVKV